jgi:hypothetical protein
MVKNFVDFVVMRNMEFVVDLMNNYSLLLIIYLYYYYYNHLTMMIRMMVVLMDTDDLNSIH